MVTEKEKKILDSLLENKRFHRKNMSEENWDLVLGEAFIKSFEEEHDVEFKTGVTKLVIVPNNEDFVLKIPFDGTAYRGKFYLFCGAADLEEGKDYCRAEELHYKEAKAWDLDFLFAETVQISEINGVPIYRQPKCELFEVELLSQRPTEETQTTVEKACTTYDYRCFNEDWLAEVVMRYGVEVLHNLLSFLNYEDIIDLHDNNIGFLNGKPVLFDYASFDD